MVFVQILFRSYRLDVRDDNLLQVLVHGLSITPMRGRLRNVPVLREGILRMAAFSSSRVDDLGRQQMPAYRSYKHHGDGPLTESLASSAKRAEAQGFTMASNQYNRIFDDCKVNLKSRYLTGYK